jgi:hypothetical protein
MFALNSPLEMGSPLRMTLLFMPCCMVVSKAGFCKVWVQNVFKSNRMVLLAHCRLADDATDPHNANGVIVPEMDPPGPTLYQFKVV